MGKIGKPQKSKKHKKMKKTFDSSLDGEFESLPGNKRHKLSNLPVNAEDLDRQEIPQKVRDIIHSKNTIRKTQLQNKGKQKKKKNKFRTAAESTFHMERGAAKPMKSIPRFVQGKFEKDRDFIRRVQLETHRVIMKTQMEEKYKIEMPETGPLNPVLNPGVKKITKEKKKEKDKERKKKKLQARRDKKAEKTMDFSALKDHVTFGEVAMAPPSLTVKPRKANSDQDKPRLGKRSLLLNDLIKGDNSASSSSTSQSFGGKSLPKSPSQRQAGQTVKRKFLSPVQQQITDFQRQKAIDLYRKMKGQKEKKMSHANS